MIPGRVQTGKGAALLTGFGIAAGRADWAITIDGDGQHPAPHQHLLRQPLGPGGIGQAAVQDRFDGGIAARQGVADHHHVRLGIQMGRVITLH